MERGYKFRIYPNKNQEEFLDKCFDGARYVYNLFLEANNRYYSHSKKFHFYNEMSSILTIIKKVGYGVEWLNDIPSTVLQQSLKILDRAICQSLSKVKNRKRYPSFKKKNKSKKSFTLTEVNYKMKDGYLHITHCPELLKVKLSRDIPSKSKNCTISKDLIGHYYISFTVTEKIDPLPKTDKVIALDMGISSFTTDSCGNKTQLPKKISHLTKRIKQEQRRLSKKKIGSRGFKKTKHNVAKLHKNIVNIKTDFHNKLVHQLINENQVIVVESLAIAEMKEKSYYARGISLAAWGNFITKLENKALKHERTIHKVNRYFPSSQLCSRCNYRWGKLSPRIRELNCPSCDELHDRDINAARNILIEYLI